jgi:hypothetical protein
MKTLKRSKDPLELQFIYEYNKINNLESLPERSTRVDDYYILTHPTSGQSPEKL